MPPASHVRPPCSPQGGSPAWSAAVAGLTERARERRRRATGIPARRRASTAAFVGGEPRARRYRLVEQLFSSRSCLRQARDEGFAIDRNAVDGVEELAHRRYESDFGRLAGGLSRW